MSDIVEGVVVSASRWNIGVEWERENELWGDWEYIGDGTEDEWDDKVGSLPGWGRFADKGEDGVQCVTGYERLEHLQTRSESFVSFLSMDNVDTHEMFKKTYGSLAYWDHAINGNITPKEKPPAPEPKPQTEVPSPLWTPDSEVHDHAWNKRYMSYLAGIRTQMTYGFGAEKPFTITDTGEN